MYTIQTNASGTRSMEISEKHLETIEKYSLFQQLIDSNGIVDETVSVRLTPAHPSLYQMGKRKRRERGTRRN